MITWILKSTSVICVASRGNVQIRVSVDVIHGDRFRCPILRGILNDAKRIDPEVLNSEMASKFNGLAKHVRKFWKRDLLQQLLHIANEQTKYFDFPPIMAKCHVANLIWKIDGQTETRYVVV